MNADLEEQEDELLALQSIFDSEEFVRNESKPAGEIRVSAELPAGFTVLLKEGETIRQYEISFLPPLVVTFELPENYPSSSPPSFSLTCSWLTHTQLSALAAQLTDLYQATGGSVVLFSWVQFLREDALKFVDIHNLLELPSDQHSTQYNSQDTQSAALCEPKNNQHSPNSGPTKDQSCIVSDPLKPDLSAPSLEVHNTWTSSSDPLDQTGQGAASLPVHHREPPQNKDQTCSGLTPSQTLLSQILIYDADQKQKVFAKTVFDCSVCFMSLLGADCVQLLDCGHIFCQACLAEFCKVQIKEGTVRGVTCPQADCTGTPTPDQVRSLVGEELFSRYDRLLLQSTLDSMSDVVYCPRRSCGSAVILETSSTAALCSVCDFAFCVTCRKTYHGTDDCATMKPQRERKEGVQEDPANMPQSYEGIKALMDDYNSGSKERRRLLENRYGRRIMLFTMEEYLSDHWLTHNSKSCPHCFTKIEKNGGCNMMTCSRCRQRFCWACLSRLSSVHVGENFESRSCSSCSFYQP